MASDPSATTRTTALAGGPLRISQGNQAMEQGLRLSGQIVRCADLTAADHADMLRLMSRHYLHVCPIRFRADLAEKHWVLRLVDDQTGTLAGFSTQMLLETPFEGRPIKALFSGDTIVDRQAWGSPALAICWGQLAFDLLARYPQSELYWFLISQGYRTYRFLPVCFQEFYPRYDAATPPELARVLDHLAACKFPHSYDPCRGVVRAAADDYCLRPGLAELTPARLSDPHVRYFLQRNPNHAEGDELCCLAPLTADNFSRAARRLIASPRFARRGEAPDLAAHV